MNTEDLNRCLNCGGTIELDEQTAQLRCCYCHPRTFCKALRNAQRAFPTK